jgi:hypothetical protein
MTRPLSFLSDATLDRLLSLAMAAARRRGGRFVWINGCPSWHGPQTPLCIDLLLVEHVLRNQRSRIL